VSLRATWILEPPRLEIGETATVELAVVTPPGHHLAPQPPPEALEGVWVLSTEAPRVERGASRWVHHVRYRIRARETGAFRWPAWSGRVEGPDGAVRTVEADARPFEVREVSSDYPEQRSFFSFRAPEPAPSRPGGGLVPALAGALATLALVGAFVGVRRLRARGAAAAVARRPVRPPPGRPTRAALEAADALAEQDVDRAADMASAALRVYVTRRFGADWTTATTEELASAPPPVGLGERTGAWLELLRQLDALRFAPERSRPADACASVRAAIDRGRTLVSDAEPVGAP
jgi:hypothetical protein